MTGRGVLLCLKARRQESTWGWDLGEAGQEETKGLGQRRLGPNLTLPYSSSCWRSLPCTWGSGTGARQPAQWSKHSTGWTRLDLPISAALLAFLPRMFTPRPDAGVSQGAHPWGSLWMISHHPSSRAGGMVSGTTRQGPCCPHSSRLPWVLVVGWKQDPVPSQECRGQVFQTCGPAAQVPGKCGCPSCG